METGVIIGGFLVTVLASVFSAIGVAFGIIRHVNGVRVELSGEIKEVRQASETAHGEINRRLGSIETTLATHTERFNTVGARIDCIEDKIDKLSP